MAQNLDPAMSLRTIYEPDEIIVTISIDNVVQSADPEVCATFRAQWPQNYANGPNGASGRNKRTEGEKAGESEKVPYTGVPHNSAQ